MWPGGPALDLCVATIYKAFQQATSYKPRSTRHHLQATSYTTTTPCYNLHATSHYTVASVTTFATRLFALCRRLHYKTNSQGPSVYARPMGPARDQRQPVNSVSSSNGRSHGTLQPGAQDVSAPLCQLPPDRLDQVS